MLDEEDDLLEDAVGIAPAADRVEGLDDLAPPLLGVRLDVGATQHVEIGRCLRDRDRPGCKSVAVGAVAHDPVRVDHGERPAHGARKAQAAAVPAHRLREREPAQDRVQLFGEDLGEQPSRHLHAEEAVARLELFDRDAVALCEARGRLLGDLHGRPFHPLVRRPFRDVLDEHRQPTRRDEDAAGLGPEHVPAQLRQLPQRLVTRRSGQLFAADLNQERRHRLPRRAGRSGARACGRGRCTRHAR